MSTEPAPVMLHLAVATGSGRLWCFRPGCTVPLPRPGKSGGRPRSYCSATCRKLAHEQRKAAEVAYRHALRVLRQYARPTDVGHDSADRWTPEAVDAAGALLLHARRAAESLRAKGDQVGVERAAALLTAADLLEQVLSRDG